MNITEYDYTGISSAVAASQIQTVKQAETQQNEIKKDQEVKSVDTYEHIDASDTPASIGIYDASGKLAGTGEAEKQRSENNNNNENSSEQKFEQKTETKNLNSSAPQESEKSEKSKETEKSDSKSEAASKTSEDSKGSGGSAPVTSSSDDNEDSTESKVVNINGEAYLETTVIKDGVKTVTRKNLETGETQVIRTQNS